MERKEISKAVISRLPRYYRYLGELIEEGVERISSNELSARMKVTASQIRQDLNNFGGFGQQGYGYNVKYLYSEIAKILGIDRQHNVIIIGAGNLGQAIANYTNFERRGFVIRGMFDINPKLIGLVIRGIEIRSVDDLETFIRENEIQIAALTIPKTKAPEIADRLVNAGIRAIWNFAHTDLVVPEDVVVENQQAIEMTQIYRDIIKGTRELLSAVIDNRLNTAMKYLASITIVMAIPTIISGIYGMNVDEKWMPLANTPFGFGIICLITLGLCLIVIRILRKRKML